MPSRSLKAPPNTGEMGHIYLLHFDRPFGHAGHYLGWAAEGNLERRLEHHANGTGANLLRHVRAAGIGWVVARTWRGDRNEERRLKNRGGKSRMCPTCGVAARQAPAAGREYLAS